MTDVEAEVPPAIPAATVVLLRDSDDGLETLMLHRTSKVAFGGMWVFPGGRVEDADRQPDDPDDEAAARRAAVREAHEECALSVHQDDVVPFSHWTPPAKTPRRYATWFFLARASDGEVMVDGAEIRDHRWLTPREVLHRRERGEVDLAPPTWVTLSDLADLPTVDVALAMAGAREQIPRYETRWSEVGGSAVALWFGDAGFDASDASIEGSRHRLWMTDAGWRYERD
jgi:8-oxo-dGTP pyrophosphatase MutT (NUDIX family)